MDHVIDVIVKGGLGALAGALAGVLLFGTAPPSNQPAECVGTGIPSDTGTWSCVTTDGTMAFYPGPTMDHVILPGFIGGIAGTAGSLLLFGRKIGWGNED